MSVVNEISVQVSPDHYASEMGAATSALKDLIAHIRMEVEFISADFSSVLRDRYAGETAGAVEQTSSSELVRFIYEQASSLEESLRKIRCIRERNTLK